jgi:starch phosphorylase
MSSGLLDQLRDLALDLTWSWDPRIRHAFEALDTGLWNETHHNPVALLERMGPAAVEEAARNSAGPAVEAALAAADRNRNHRPPELRAGAPLLVAYFSLEFGLCECLPVYSGGLGILAGDHLKAASDAGLPLVAVGLFYRHGFGRQRIDAEGNQIELYPENLPQTLPVEPVEGPDGRVIVTAPIGPETVRIAAWRVRVGRVHLLLLDTDLDANPPGLRDITDRLYVAEPEARLRQEIVLGIGGMRLLRTLRLEPTVFHMNEGHSFLVGLERIRELQRSHQLTIEEAWLVARAGIVFTTHTPVAAGSDYFEPALVRRLLGAYLGETGIAFDRFMDLGRERPGDETERLCTTYAALRLSDHSFAVSRLHRDVSRRLWKAAWPRLAEAQVPIGCVTNGAHMPSWLAPEIAELVTAAMGPDWWARDADDPAWQQVEQIPADRLWSAHEGLRRRLVEYARSLTKDARPLQPEALTIGFSRRFAAYKRATLILTDRERLGRIVGSGDRPVQFVFAGKAHPADAPAKALLHEIVLLSRENAHVVFLEDYDIEIARHLVQGCDVWLNNPRRFLEASGTSGIKAGANGALNVSVLDGWWNEGYSPGIGWAIPSGATIERPQADDEAEADGLYRVLEREVVPLFYRRGPSDIPEEWISMMRRSIRELLAHFSARRMVFDYFNQAYAPAARRVEQLRLLPDWGG